MRYFVALLFSVTLAGQAAPGLKDPEVERLEAVVARNPADADATTQLLNRYSGLLGNPETPIELALAARRRHILWLIENSPDSRALAGPPAGIDVDGPRADPEGHAKAAELWLRQVSKPDAKPKTIANAAYFFRGTDRARSFELMDGALKAHPKDPDLLNVRGALDALVMVGATGIRNGQITDSDPAQRRSPQALNARREIETSSDAQLIAGASDFLAQNAGPLTRDAVLDEDPLALAEKWAARARELEPGNPGRTNFLIAALTRESNASLDPREKARYLERALQIAIADPQRTRVLLQLANIEFEARNDEAAERAAHQLLEMAAANPKLGNHDDLIHLAHMVLGRVALAQGQKEEAKNQLLESVRVKGSPELRNGGPKMLLAQDLLDAGERETVAQYLNLCRSFWTNDRGKLDRLAAVVQSGGKDLLAVSFPPSPNGPPKKIVLGAPAQLAPENGALLDIAGDRKVELAWAPVPGADSYVVEWDFRDAKGWQSEHDNSLVRVIPTRETTAALDFNAWRQGRWRVYAVSSRTGAGNTSDWREFRFDSGALPARALTELESGDFDGAERDARRMLAMANANPNGWSHDDLVHAAQTLLGRVALRRGNLRDAQEHLLESARISNAPVSGSFGPSMQLAQEILAAGDRDTVLQYLEMCRSFWKSDRGRLDHDVELIRSDAAPNLLFPYSNQGPALTGGKAPAFKLKDLAGKTRTLEEFSGKAVVLDFWATWCGPCRDELAALANLRSEFQSRGVTIVSVNVGEDEAAVRAFVSRERISLPVLLAGHDEVILGYRVAVFPTLAVVDQTGKIADYRVGSVNEGELKQILQLFTR